MLIDYKISLGSLDRAQHEIFSNIDLIFEDAKIQQQYVGIPVSEQVDVFRDRIYSIGE